MTRNIAEQTNTLRIFWLKKHGYLPRGGEYVHGSIKWIYGLGGHENSIGFFVATKGNDNHIRLYYTQTNGMSGEKEDFSYKVRLVTTPCNFGGTRYWFICPIANNGKPCGRRVGVLFQVGKYFGCRYCGEIAYDAQFQGGRLRPGSVTEPDVERALAEVKYKYYNGLPTRKYKRYLRLREKMDDSWRRMIARFGNIF